MKRTTEDYIWGEINYFIEINCDGCRIKHPSQKYHMLGCFSNDFFNQSAKSVLKSLYSIGVISKTQYAAFIKKYHRIG